MDCGGSMILSKDLFSFMMDIYLVKQAAGFAVGNGRVNVATPPGGLTPSVARFHAEGQL